MASTDNIPLNSTRCCVDNSAVYTTTHQKRTNNDVQPYFYCRALCGNDADPVACSGGVQVSAESSASTSASAESASAEASATPTPSPTPTGYEPVLIRANVDLDNPSKEAADATLKAAYDALEQYRRIWNAWLHGSMEHTSDEELLIRA